MCNEQELPHNRFQLTRVQEKLDRLCELLLSFPLVPQLEQDAAQKKDHSGIIRFELKDGLDLGPGLIVLSALEIVGAQLPSHCSIIGI